MIVAIGAIVAEKSVQDSFIVTTVEKIDIYTTTPDKTQPCSSTHKLTQVFDRADFPVVVSSLQEAQAKGLIERDLVQVKPTERGFDFLSDLQALFLA